MEALQRQIRFEDDRIGAIKFVKQQHLVVSHNRALTLLNVKDNFNHKFTFTIPSSALRKL